jgi:micrococcal nuclease
VEQLLRPHRCAAWISAVALALFAQAPVASPPRAAPRSEGGLQGASTERKDGADWVEIEKVVDGDTIHVRRGGRVEKLRLLSVDTEERFGPGHTGTATKPLTVFGEETALWAEKLFADLSKGAAPGKPVNIGLLFPGGAEKRDVYGRLLCHVLLPDGTDFNLMLVQLGKSPYFNKYGDDAIDHEAFVAAQRSAREAKLGIWNPSTNEPKTPGAPESKRPYPELLAWWNARAIAIESWRKRFTAEPGKVADAEDPATLDRAARAGAEVEVFGEVDRIFPEKNGDKTVLFRTSEKGEATRVVIPAAFVSDHDKLDLSALTREFRQNYVWVRGVVHRGSRGFEMRSDGPERWRRAGPEPALPAPRFAR